MNCDELRHLVDEYLDGNLSEEDTGELEAHLADCRECAVELESLSELRGRVARLPRSINPPRDLWPGIENRIASAKVVTGRFRRRAVLAAAAVMLLVSSVITAYMVGRQQAAPAVAIAPERQQTASEVLRASFAEIGVHDYEATRKQLQDVLDRREGELSQETMDVVRKNLRLIDEAMGEIAEALGEDPGNELLMRQLASAYRRQIDLLGRAANLPSEV